MNSSSGLEPWLRDRPKWLQAAAAHLLREGQVSAADITWFVELAIEEAGGPKASATGARGASIPPGALDTPCASHPLRLVSIREPIGINALAPREPLRFGQGPLTVVYGPNGAGKSGYMRLLKAAAGCRFAGPILPDVYKNGKVAQSATFVLQLGEEIREVRWGAEGQACNELRPLQLFDSTSAEAYLNSATETAVEPFALQFLTRLVELADQVSRRLSDLRRQHQTHREPVPTECADPDLAAWYLGLSATTPDREIDANCRFDELEFARIPGHRPKLVRLTARIPSG